MTTRSPCRCAIIKLKQCPHKCRRARARDAACCQERPEILRQLPNDIDIQNEQFWWDRRNGACICASLLELRDKKSDMMSKEGDPEAYERVADQLGYDTVGVPASDDDDLKFSEYRQSGDLGTLSERRWEREIAWSKPERELSLIHI